MSISELLVIFIVALIVFGPSKLPMLANHLGSLFHYMNRFKQQLQQFWQTQLNEQQLTENECKAKEADKTYKKD